jgi:hypothetical protein
VKAAKCQILPTKNPNAIRMGTRRIDRTNTRSDDHTDHVPDQQLSEVDAWLEVRPAEKVPPAEQAAFMPCSVV